jgi:shikimate kinase
VVEKAESLLSIQNIILIGFMAAGKSSVGRLLARELNWDFLDTDTRIEQVTGLKIPELFQKHGEERFRFEEDLIVKKLVGKKKTIIATGGGMVLSSHNWNSLRRIGIFIHLYVPLEIALARVMDPQGRPLLTKSRVEIVQLWKERLDKYNKADITIDTSDKEIVTIVAEILTQVKGGYHNVTEN